MCHCGLYVNMAKLKKFEIFLSNPQVVYFPGQCLQGHLIVELDEEMEMRGISLTCQGKGNVQWNSGQHLFVASETYLSETLKLFGNDSHESGQVTLNAGNHSFPFQIVLPANAPGSFEGLDKCFVRYFLNATIYGPKKCDKHFKMLFTVATRVDLNTVVNASVVDKTGQELELLAEQIDLVHQLLIRHENVLYIVVCYVSRIHSKSPAQATDAKAVCCMCCESDPVSATFRIDKIGYVPGESVVFDAEIQDGTGRGINSSAVTFSMLTVYKIFKGGAKKELKREICRLQHDNVIPGQTDVWRREKLRIPPVPPSYLSNCSLIEIHYIIELVVAVAYSPFDLHVPLSVVIGTIPLHSVDQQYWPLIQSGTISEQPQASGALGFSARANADLPPPSYKEYVLGKVNTIDEDEQNSAGEKTFAPSYTYYDFS